ncbi:hypothetical protein GQ53DRAFT_337333 [Thozetella sp. PMI_491]|nr:hypothetical protein GQ53DRAFT_337333 [Thozetella sp. PMI_491]
MAHHDNTRQYNPSEHGGLEANPMADGGHAPEVVPNSYHNPEQEKIVGDAHSQYRQGQWGQEPIPPQYPGTPSSAYTHTHASPYPQHPYQYPPGQYEGGQAGYPPGTAAGASITEEKKPAPTLFGIPKTRALVIMGVGAIALLAIALGVGVGVGLSTSKSSSSSSSSTTTDAPTSTSSAGPVSTEVGCPDANNSRYTTSSNKTFIRYCGIDFGDGSEAKNINSVKTTSMTDCMNACGAFEGCQGAGWGYMDSDKGNLHNCYMKSSLNQSHTAVAGWNFAILQPSNLTQAQLSGLEPSHS